MRLMTLFAAGLIVLAGCSKQEAAPEPAPAVADATAPAAPVASPQERIFGAEELDQMVAPIALYPDPVLAQVLMATTYPGEVADAVAWSKAHPDAKGDAAVRQVADQPWDASVQSLVAFPQALDLLGQDPAWVQKLGDAFLAQPNDVMDAVQRLRHQAQAAGNLASNEYQTVSAQQAAPPAGSAAPAATGAVDTAPAQAQQAIVIEPAQPDVVYVPSYNPTTVYGTWAYPAYPPVYYPPPRAYYPVGTALASGIAFGVGLAITDSIWGGFGWDHWGHDDVDIDIDVNRYNNINVNKRLDVDHNTWRHDPVHRDGVPYRDSHNRDMHGRQLEGVERRTAYRGDDAARSQAREQARSSMERHGVQAPVRTNAEARERVQQVDRDQARQHAQAASERARTATPEQRSQARDRAQGATERARSATPEQRSQARQAAQQRAPQAQPRVQQKQGNTAARTTARSQSPQASRSNAFQGASHPSSSRAAAQRGQASQQASRQHASASRPAGRPVSRPANPPHRGARR